MIAGFDELIEAAVAVGPKRVAVAAANDRETLAAVVEARTMGIAEPVLVGNQEWMELVLGKLGTSADEFETLSEKDSATAVAGAVEIVRSGRAEILMKGNVLTSKFLHAALSPAGGLRGDGLLSDVLVYEDTRRQGTHLVLLSDAGINISPNIRQKLEIVRNAVAVAHRLGIRQPKVALLSGSERVHPDFQSTIDAVALVKMCQYGEVEGCVVDGPFALDNAIDPASAQAKGIESPVAGRADALIVPNLESGNMFGKALQYYAGKMLAHVAVGAKVPILIDSRTAPAAGKLRSLALASLMCGEKPAH